MNHSNQINWTRRFYRRHLELYKWARLFKQAYLVLRLRAIEIHGFLVWRVEQTLAVGAGYELRSIAATAILPISRSERLSPIVYRALLRVLNLLTGQQAWLYEMRGFSEYFSSSDVACIELAPARELPLEMPSVYPEEFRKLLYRDSWQLRLPAICAFEVSEAQVMGKSDLLYVKDQCLHHELYRFDQDFLFEEMHGIVSINAAKKILVRLKGRQLESIPSGISLVGSATANYVHWLTETLPKLALIDCIDAYRNLPYIIDAGLHPNILSSFQHLNKNGRNVIKLAQGEMLFVERLVAISPVAYVPFEFKPGIKPEKLDINPSSSLYSPDGLQQVRRLMVACLGKTSGKIKRRLFLRRTGKSRPMKNSTEVEATLGEHGFEIIEPEKLSFVEQVQLFSSAEFIVSQGGAALGNIIFAPEACNIIVLTTWSPYTIHYYFANLAAILGQRCTLIMCEPVQCELGAHRAHMGVNVPIPTLINAIQQ